MPDDAQSPSQHQALLAQGLSNDSLTPAPEIQGYEIESCIGRGGMSVVYLARETALDRMVALKIFDIDEIAEVSRARFQQEALMMASIQHPNIVSIYSLLTDDPDAPCLVLEYVAGGDLRSKLIAKKHFTPAETLQIVIDICQGLSEIHKHDIVHRDIKPENILLTKEGLAKVADLGIAINNKPNGSTPSLTKTGTFVGTLAYLSPEQTTESHKCIDSRSDIWAVGILIYELLIGPPPRVMLVSDLMQNIPPAFKPVLKKCLRHNPDDRYANIDQLLASLTHIQKFGKQRILFHMAFGILTVSALVFFISLFNEDPPLAQLESKQGIIKTELNQGNWVNLIPLLPSPLNSVRGEWSLDDGTLSCHSESLEACMVLLAEPIGENYDLSLNFIRVTNQDSIIVYLPTSIGMLDFHIDGWRQHLSGIQDLDHQDMRAHGETFPFTITNRKLYKLLIKVRSNSIEVKINGKSYYTWDLSEKHGSLNHTVTAFPGHQVGLGAWQSTTHFMDVRIKKIKK